MSYCRFSSDDFCCDLYCYADCSGGYTTHVASHRHVGDCGKLNWEDSPEKLSADMNAQIAFLKACKYEEIKLPYAGQYFNDATLGEFRDRLVELKNLGYRFPADVFTQVDEEMAGY